ncbi:hypothetical protein FOL47_009833 [Perkinsus chesapeaki]|uniref:Uncharacterized protein n=1 Tax=Perkinsus chesapeaki TaxID=330153 RepID=A0A7J6L698_PERCH|nr:hypothetical protein FOL47_009833 [Perkinsus chesapeaki]
MSALIGHLTLSSSIWLGLGIQGSNKRTPDWYYCHEDFSSGYNKILFAPNGTEGFMRTYFQDMEISFSSPYHIDEGGYVTLGDSISGKSLNDSRTFPYMSVHYTLKYDSENDVVIMTNTSGMVFNYTPCHSSASIGRPNQRILSQGNRPPLYPHLYYCAERMCVLIDMSIIGWVIGGWIHTEDLKTTPCWHWLSFTKAFDIDSHTADISSPYTSFDFTLQRVNGSMIELQPHHSGEETVLLYGLDEQPYQCPP